MSTLIHLMLKQNIGAMNTPVVKVGDTVKRGQIVADYEGLGAYIYSSVNGKVCEITEDRITIEADDITDKDYVKLPETDSYLEAIKLAGVVGAGGAGFPTHVKLNTQIPGGMVIANAAECEPILGHNIKYLEEHADVIVRGLKYMLEITGAEEAIIAIKPHHTKALLACDKACKNEPKVSVKYLPNMYPAGDERVIVRELTGVELQPGQLPLEAKCIIDNVETIKNITQAIEDRKPVIDKDLTVAGRLMNEDCSHGKYFLDVPIGLPVGHYIDLCGGIRKPFGEIVIGGPFTGKHGEMDTPITKLVGGIIVSDPFLSESRKIGIIACECGAQEPRLKEIAESMGATVVAEERCKRMKPDKGGRLRCDLPGICPGQAETVLKLKKEGAEALLIANCED